MVCFVPLDLRLVPCIFCKSFVFFDVINISSVFFTPSCLATASKGCSLVKKIGKYQTAV